MSEQKKICLFGDEQMKPLSDAMSSMDVEHFGGMIMNAVDIAKGNFSSCDKNIFFINKEYPFSVNWELTLNAIRKNITDTKVITNFAVQSSETIDEVLEAISRSKDVDDASLMDYVNVIKSIREKQLSIITKLRSEQIDVTVISDSPFFMLAETYKSKRKYINKYFNALEYLFAENDVKFLNMSIIFNNSIDNHDDYIYNIEQDSECCNEVLPNDKYYSWLAKELLNNQNNQSYWFDI